ncbi:L-gulonolactone/D-arabinono-1,4-lactone oxidase [Thozetella sp. PMI_491]|nr:L-gulonolactone/D-arabinono-1,4-lactone oxidase [Thozetella sp. PMI_491]
MAPRVEPGSAILAKIQADPDFDNGIPFNASTGYTHGTWARTFTSLPELYVQPASLAEVEKAVHLARRYRRRITTVGSGHSPSDLTCTSSWLMNLDRFNKILEINTETGLTRMQSGIRLWQLSEELDRWGLAMPNLGSINEQSIAGVISTGTHGSSLERGLVSEAIEALKITLADGTTKSCSPTENPELFRGALLSLGALGIITEVTFRAVPAFSLEWDQTIDTEARIFREWEQKLWKQSDFVRVWWFPYMRRAVVWKADIVTQDDLRSGRKKHYDPPTSYYDGWLGYVIYHNLLALSRYVPRILPWVEWFVFGMQYGFRNGDATRIKGLQPSRQAMLMNCLYSQFVDEWALPLHKGPEALQRLASWLHNLKPGDAGYVEHGIPYSAEGLYVHSPVEVRVSDTTIASSAARNNRPFLSPACADGPTLYLNAIMYRPYHLDPTYDATFRYYQGFEYLMRSLGGRPHWAKNFYSTAADVETWYGADLDAFRAVRDEVDPEGLFVGPWQRRYLLGGTAPDRSGTVHRLPLEEVGFVGEPSRDGSVVVRGSHASVVPN